MSCGGLSVYHRYQPQLSTVNVGAVVVLSWNALIMFLCHSIKSVGFIKLHG